MIMNAGSRNPRAVAIAALDIPMELQDMEEDEGSCYDDDLWDDWYDDWPYDPLDELYDDIQKELRQDQELGSCYFDDEERNYSSY